ncbi:MAG: hypothetical protein K0S65_2528 [Labilithrix sp.]|nr:hypothetical protein [Labilithrix sp.]
MRRTVFSSITVMSLTALAIAIGACATAPVDDDLSGLTQEQSPAEPTDDDTSAKLPPSSAPDNDPVTDAGTDAKAPPKDASAPKDASTPPADSGNPTSGGDCDPSDPTYLIKFIAAPNPTPCPCSASECCYQSLVCLPK